MDTHKNVHSHSLFGKEINKFFQNGLINGSSLSIQVETLF